VIDLRRVCGEQRVDDVVVRAVDLGLGQRP
jgi:hypothetical protein